MSSLYELTGYYAMLQNMLDSDELSDEEISERLNDLNDEIEIKADNYAKMIRNFETSLEGIKAEAKRLSDRKSKLEANIKRLKDDLQTAMVTTGKTKFKTDLFSFGVQKNGGALPVIVDVDTSELPDDLVIISEKPDLKAIEKYIKETGDVTFAHFGERGESLRIK